MQKSVLKTSPIGLIEDMRRFENKMKYYEFKLNYYTEILANRGKPSREALEINKLIVKFVEKFPDVLRL